MITKSIYESGRLVTGCFTGVVTMLEIEQYFYWLVENHNGKIKEGFSQLIYSSELDKVDIQVNDVHRISHLRATIGLNSRSSNLALVIPELKYYWMATLYKTLSKSTGIKTNLFRNVDDAFVWLDFDNPVKCLIK